MANNGNNPHNAPNSHRSKPLRMVHYHPISEEVAKQREMNRLLMSDSEYRAQLNGLPANYNIENLVASYDSGEGQLQQQGNIQQ